MLAECDKCECVCIGTGGKEGVGTGVCLCLGYGSVCGVGRGLLLVGLGLDLGG